MEYLLLMVVVALLALSIGGPLGRYLTNFSGALIGPTGYYACLTQYGLLPSSVNAGRCQSHIQNSLNYLNQIQDGSIFPPGKPGSGGGGPGSSGGGDGSDGVTKMAEVMEVTEAMEVMEAMGVTKMAEVMEVTEAMEVMEAMGVTKMAEVMEVTEAIETAKIEITKIEKTKTALQKKMTAVVKALVLLPTGFLS